jgi:hypothetical protein
MSRFTPRARVDQVRRTKIMKLKNAVLGLAAMALAAAATPSERAGGTVSNRDEPKAASASGAAVKADDVNKGVSDESASEPVSVLQWHPPAYKGWAKNSLGYSFFAWDTSCWSAQQAAVWHCQANTPYGAWCWATGCW